MYTMEYDSGCKEKIKSLNLQINEWNWKILQRVRQSKFSPTHPKKNPNFLSNQGPSIKSFVCLTWNTCGNEKTRNGLLAGRGTFRERGSRIYVK